MLDDKRIPLLELDSLLLAIRRLNMTVPNEYPILSLYLTAQANKRKLKENLAWIDEQMRTIYQKLTTRGLDIKIMQEDIERIKEFIEFNLHEEMLGLAAFISGYRDIFLTYPISYSFKPQVVLANDVYKAPLVQLLTEQPPEIILLLQEDYSVLYRYLNGKLQQKEEPVKRNSGKEANKDYMRRVKDAYWPYFRSNDVHSVFLLGQPALIEDFFSVLAKTVVHKIKEKIEISPKVSHAQLERITNSLIRKYHIINPQQKVEHAKQMAQRGLALFGSVAVLKALRDGKVKELLLTPGFNPSGFRCQRCSLLQVEKPKLTSCSWCQGPLQKIKQLKTAVLRDANFYNTQVTRVNHAFLKGQGEGIGALLRFA